MAHSGEFRIRFRVLNKTVSWSFSNIRDADGVRTTLEYFLPRLLVCVLLRLFS
jgi:hypothetical protein